MTAGLKRPPLIRKNVHALTARLKPDFTHVSMCLPPSDITFLYRSITRYIATVADCSQPPQVSSPSWCGYYLLSAFQIRRRTGTKAFLRILQSWLQSGFEVYLGCARQLSACSPTDRAYSRLCCMTVRVSSNSGCQGGHGLAQAWRYPNSNNCPGLHAVRRIKQVGGRNAR